MWCVSKRLRRPGRMRQLRCLPEQLFSYLGTNINRPEGISKKRSG